jgi:transcriptional regulator with XRE-family HTH domain
MGSQQFGAAEMRQRRAALGLTQAALAELLGVSTNTVARWERGELTIRNPRLVKMALDRAAARPLRAQAPSQSQTNWRSGRHLPQQHWRLVGREHEVEDIVSQLRRPEIRLVTLFGPGGVGKTHLALAVATEAAKLFADGACFVDLTPVHDPELVLPAVLHALGIQESGTASVEESVVTAFSGRDMLLLLDNFEQVIQAAPILSKVLESCPTVKILATTRQLLRLRWEVVFEVPPLRTADPWHVPPLEELARVPAVMLLVDRARAASPSFALLAEAGELELVRSGMRGG